MRNITLYAFQATDILFDAIAHYCSNLFSVKVDDIYGNLTDASLRALAGGTPLIQELLVFGGKKMTDAGVLALSRGCLELQTLRLSMSTTLTKASLLEVIKNCKNIRKIQLRGCTDWLPEYLHLRDDGLF